MLNPCLSLATSDEANETEVCSRRRACNTNEDHKTLSRRSRRHCRGEPKRIEPSIAARCPCRWHAESAMPRQQLRSPSTPGEIVVALPPPRTATIATWPVRASRPHGQCCACHTLYRTAPACWHGTSRCSGTPKTMHPKAKSASGSLLEATCCSVPCARSRSSVAVSAARVQGRNRSRHWSKTQSNN